ncbi:MAG TPA: sigma-70 family RNA polymerase sigma factor [Acidimicrobiales bacterium]|nr:sigma-70 family RNA polymerase sigma factor [Acidimicrobiales bacterium]
MTPLSRSHDDTSDPRFELLRRTGDLEVRNALVEDFAWLASFCASRFARRGEPREDLVQVALVGLVNAVDRFDPRRGLSFTTFAVPTIEGELRRYFRDRTWAIHVTRRVKDASRATAAAVDDLTSALGRTPTADEVAERTGLRPEEVLEALDVHSLQRGVPLEQGDGDDAHESVALGVDEAGYESAEARTILAELLPALPTARDRLIVELRFVEGMTQSEIARRIGVSQVQVSRLLRLDLERMRRAASRRRRPVAG